MTSVTVSGQSKEHSWIRMQEVKTGKWYIIRDYEHNRELIGEIGIGCQQFEISPVIICPKGSVYSHPDLMLEEIRSIQIQYKF